jgi:hypothetical protein
MKYVAPRPFADPAVAARKLLEIATTEAVRMAASTSSRSKGRCLKEGGTPAEYGAGIAVGACNFFIKPRRTGYLVAGTQTTRARSYGAAAEGTGCRRGLRAERKCWRDSTRSR